MDEWDKKWYEREGCFWYTSAGVMELGKLWNFQKPRK